MTVFDGQRAVWMWQFSAQAEKSVTVAATTLRQYAGASVLLIKAMSGQTWQSTFDHDQNAISGFDSLHAAIAEGQQAGVTVVPWVEATGPQDAPAHAALGDTLVVDLEQPPNFWQADPAQIAVYMQALRAGGVQNLFVCLDARAAALSWTQFDAWHQLVSGVLPMCYWPDFQRPYLECVRDVTALSKYGLPIYPVVEFNSQLQDLTAFWQSLPATAQAGCSLWVLGDANGAQLQAFSQLAVKRQPPPLTNDDLVQTERYLLAQPPDVAGAISYLQRFV